MAKRKEQEQSSLWVQNQTLHQWGPLSKKDLGAQNLKQELEKTEASYLEIVEKKNQENTSIKNKIQQTEVEKIVLQQRAISARDKPDSSQTQNETTQQSSQEKESNIIKPDNSQAPKRHSREICKKNMNVNRGPKWKHDRGKALKEKDAHLGA